MEVVSCIDTYSIFKRAVSLTGWAYGRDAPITSMALRFPGGREYPLQAPELPSGDVAAAHGDLAAKCRFDAQIIVNEPHDHLLQAELIFKGDLGQQVVVTGLTRLSPAESTHWLEEKFRLQLAGKADGRYLEVGSRARSGITRRGVAPPSWQYVGLDVLPGENVDVVGDAHQLSRLFQGVRFDAVAAFSVLEHILMPWKFIVELNRTLNTGAVGLFTTHQCWPVHDAPWDFWRFSDTAWAALFNQATGFEIIQTALGERGHVVAAHCHTATHFGDIPGGYLSSAVMFRKIGETTLDWPVRLEEITSTLYPDQVQDIRL